MPEAPQYGYVTLLDVRFRALELIDEKSLSDACPHAWYNQTLCTVNNSVVRLGVVAGEYHWHKHDSEDEFLCHRRKVVDRPERSQHGAGSATGRSDSKRY